jgi:hypothetical protein
MQQKIANPDRITIHCPGCQAKIGASRKLLGRVCPCPRCRQAIVVQPPLPSDADINLVMDERSFAPRR